jgi:pSer/pThr/pTyr-binding forkhead associated (FHA) protein
MARGEIMAPTVTLTVKNGFLAGKAFTFRGPREITVGRGKDCDLRLGSEWEFQTISRHQCQIQFAASEVRVHDMGSHNGTYLNGMQIGRPASWHLSGLLNSLPFQDYALHNGDELRMGGTVFQVAIASLPQDARFPVKGTMAQKALAEQPEAEWSLSEECEEEADLLVCSS